MVAQILILEAPLQRDRLDIAYYDPRFLQTDSYFGCLPYPLVPLEIATEQDACYGILPPSSEYSDDGMLLVRSTDLSPEGVDYEKTVRVPRKYMDSRARIIKGDVLIGVKGACAFFDIYAVTEDPPAAIINGSIFRFQCTSDYLPTFIALWLLSTPVQTSVFRERANLGISYISLDVLKAIQVPSLPISDQQKIVDRFRAIHECALGVEALLEETSAKWAKLTRKADKILEDHLGLLPPPSSGGKIRVLTLEDQNDRMDWGFYDPSRITTVEELSNCFDELVSVSDCGALHRDSVSPKSRPSDEFVLVRIKWHGKGAVLREIKRGADISGNLTPVMTDDVVISRIDSTQRAVAVIPEALDGAYISNEFYAIRLHKDKFLPEMLKRLLLSSRYVAYFFAQKTGSTKRLRLKEETIVSLPLPLVSTGKQQELIKSLRELDKEGEEISQQERDILALRDKIMAAVKADILAILNDVSFSFILSLGKKSSDATHHGAAKND